MRLVVGFCEDRIGGFERRERGETEVREPRGKQQTDPKNNGLLRCRRSSCGETAPRPRDATRARFFPQEPRGAKKGACMPPNVRKRGFFDVQFASSGVPNCARRLSNPRRTFLQIRPRHRDGSWKPTFELYWRRDP